MSDCPGRFKLVELIASDLAEEEASALRNHLETCTKCTTMIDDIRQNRDEYQAKAANHRALLMARLEAEPSRKKRSPWLLWISSAVLAAAAAILIVVLVGPGEPTREVSFKGSFSVQVVAKRGGSQLEVKGGSKLRKDDALRFVIVTDTRGYLSILSVNSGGDSTAFYPEAAPESAPAPFPVDAPGRHEMPGSIILDDWLGPEHLVVVFSKEPFDRKRIHQAIKRLLTSKGPPVGPSELGLDGHVEVISVLKVTR